MSKKITEKEFIEKVKHKFGDRYDLSELVYSGSKEKVCIICPKHGKMWIRADQLLSKNSIGCRKCSYDVRTKKNSLTTEEFIKKAKEVHGAKYDYSKVIYEKTNKKVCIICPEHGEFWQKPNVHLNGGGCTDCFKKRQGLLLSERNRKNFTTEDFILEARKIHEDRYDYSKTKYITAEDKVCIICPEHGEFWQLPYNHLKGHTCFKCSRKNIAKQNTRSLKDYIKIATKVHGKKYDYSKTEYQTAKEKVCIICPEHGEFWQQADSHIRGCGCPKCNKSHLETEVEAILTEKKVKYEPQKTFKWLKDEKNLLIDFYLTDYNVAIECQGEQHYKKYRFELNDNSLNKRKKRDVLKKHLCEKNHINVEYILYNDNVQEKIKEILSKYDKDKDF